MALLRENASEPKHAIMETEFICNKIEQLPLKPQRTPATANKDLTIQCKTIQNNSMCASQALSTARYIQNICAGEQPWQE